MRIRISKDFILGVAVGACGTLYFTAKKFADIIREEDKPYEEPAENDFFDMMD